MEFRSLIAVSCIMVFSSCADENQNLVSKADVKLSFRSNSSVSGSGNGRVSGHFEITRALVGIEKIEIKSDAKGEEDEHNEYTFIGPYIIDLLDGVSNPELPLSAVEPGIYNKAEAELVPVIGDSVSILIQGMFGDTPFTFMWENTEDFKAESDQGFELTEDILNNLLIDIDIHSVFEGVDFGLAAINEGGEIILSKDSNRDIADVIEQNIETASKVGLDKDLDGDLD